MPGDVALKPSPEGGERALAFGRRRPSSRPPPISSRLAELLNGSAAVTLLCGSGCAGAHDAGGGARRCAGAPIVHALRGKEHVECDNPFDVGMTGLIGFSSGYHAMLELRHAA